MKTDLLLHPKTSTQAEAFLTKPSQGLLITGAAGVGKYALAKTLAANILGLSESEKLDKYPYFYLIKRPADKQEITIDQVRALISNLTLKTPGANALRRIVIVEDANNLSTEAQNSLLKTLEEPPADTIVILTALGASYLLPTVSSRLQKLEVQPTSLNAALKYYGSQFDSEAVESAWALSQGGAGLLSALLNDEQSHPLKQGVDRFKQFLSGSRYDRLVIIDKLDKNKLELAAFIDAGARIMTVLYKEAVQQRDQSRSAKWLKARKDLLRASEQLTANVSARLLVLNLALNL